MRRWSLSSVSRTALAVVATTMFLARAEAAPNYKVLHAFTGGSDGGGVYGGVILGGNGSVFGATSGGGAYGEGTVFRLTSADGRWKETVLHSFSLHTDGESPIGTLVSDSAGNLYGATATGGNGDLGTIFELSPSLDSTGGWTLKILYESGSDYGLILDQVGNLYGPLGAGNYGGGAVTELSPGSGDWTQNYLYSFCQKSPCLAGDVPDSAFTWDANGNLYGTTEWGGNYPPLCPTSAGCGVAFQLARQSSGGWKYHLLHRFAAFNGDGHLPVSGLTPDRNTNIVYGTTLQGGSHRCGQGTGCGTVFRLTPSSDGRWKETILYKFPNPSTNGAGPGGLAIGKAGELYGAASGGGDAVCQCGVIFKMTPGTNGKWIYKVLHRFTGKDGALPGASLILDAKGNIFGTTIAGGPDGYGVVFEITP